jgi:hypothetical protein
MSWFSTMAAKAFAPYSVATPWTIGPKILIPQKEILP